MYQDDEKNDEDCRPAFRWTADSRLVRTTRCGAAQTARDEDEEA